MSHLARNPGTGLVALHFVRTSFVVPDRPCVSFVVIAADGLAEMVVDCCSGWSAYPAFFPLVLGATPLTTDALSSSVSSF